MADDSFTRSLYIGRDKAIEVARRREAAEAELKARREERIRIQNERLQRAAQTKEQELKQKCRQKQERESQRQRAVLDRRSARLEQQKAKAEELLHRVQSSTARNSQGGGSSGGNKTTKSTYVFGSSTPRELSYLERLSHEQKAYNSAMTESKMSNGTHSSKERSVSNERSLVGAKGTPLRLPSRLAPQSASIITGKRPATVQPRPNNLMTRSVFGTLNSGGAKTRTLLVPAPRATPAGAKPTPSKRGASPMTQSMYVAKTPTAATKDPAKQSAALGRLTAPTAASASRSLSKVSKSSAESNASENGAAVEAVRKPVIRPRKAVESEKKPAMGAEKMQAKTDVITGSGDTNVTSVEHRAPLPVAPPVVPPLIVESILPVLSNVSEVPNSLPMEEQEEEEERRSPESERGELLIDILGEDSAPRETTPLVQQPALSGSGSPSVMPTVDLGGGGEGSSPNLSGLQPSPISTVSSNSPVQGQHQIAAELDREREERRERLNQILQRTRMDNAAAAATVAQTNAIDASALAQDLLAQRRQQKLQQQQQAAIANGHSQNGMVRGTMNGSAPLPGQVLVGVTNEQNPLFEQNNQHFHNQSEAVIAARDATAVKDIGSLLSQLATTDTGREHVEGSDEEHMDPEDPRTNGSAGREKNKLIINP